MARQKDITREHLSADDNNDLDNLCMLIRNNLAYYLAMLDKHRGPDYKGRGKIQAEALRLAEQVYPFAMTYKDVYGLQRQEMADKYMESYA